jgi:phosphatidylinositol kinase/protein kinase (PI-3  family)
VDSECITPHIDLLLTKVAKLIDEKGKVKKQVRIQTNNPEGSHAFTPSILTYASNPSQEKALKALGQIVGTTGCVVRPYLTHPELLDGIISIIQKTDNTSDELRQEATRAFGILGVANPDKLKSMHRRLLEAAQRGNEVEGGAVGTNENSLNNVVGMVANEEQVRVKTQEQVE